MLKIITFNEKEFTEIPFGKGLYFICKDTTEILSLARPQFPKILKPSINAKGYYMVGFFTRPNRINVHIHTAMAKTFLPRPDNCTQINHIDGNKLNNTLSNLEWCDQAYNNRHAIKQELRKDFGQKEIHRYSLKGEYLESFESLAKASEKAKTSVANICYCATGKIGFAGDSIWSYTKTNNLNKTITNVIKEYEVILPDKTKKICNNVNEVLQILKIGKTKYYSLIKNKNSLLLNDIKVTKIML